MFVECQTSVTSDQSINVCIDSILSYIFFTSIPNTRIPALACACFVNLAADSVALNNAIVAFPYSSISSLEIFTVANPEEEAFLAWLLPPANSHPFRGSYIIINFLYVE